MPRPFLLVFLLAASLGATRLTPELRPITGLPVSAVPLNEGVAITQFRVPDTDAYDIHGFAARDTPAGRAALGQVTRFLLGAWDGEPVLAHPEGCSVTPDGSCDFSGMW